MTRSAAIAMMVAACAAEPPPETVPDTRAVTAAVEAWDAAGMPYTQRCSDTRGRIVFDIRPDVMAICGEDSAGIVIGCFIPPRAEGSPIIVATDDPWRRTDTIVHEACHWLSWCGLGDGDAMHANAMVWDLVYWDALARVVP